LNCWKSSRFLLLNRANKCLGEYKVSSGSTTGTVVEPKFIFAAAIKANASGIILAHNHPSGEFNPSSADITLTKKVKDGGLLFDILVLDHIIVTRDDYYSLADEGLI
jgi:DNA repair protein RadC